MGLIRYFSHFLSLLYPELCAGCGRSLYEHESWICSHCWYEFPFTYFHMDPQNPVARQLWGRVPILQATAYLYFVKSSPVQKVLHQMKYAAKPEIGRILGKRYGEVLKETAFAQADLIIPVPLHPKKQKKRGYNQSAYIAQGLSEVLKIPYNGHELIRIDLRETQTAKKRFERYENMRSVFRVNNPESFENQHILLVDDVFTTGATIEACVEALRDLPGIKISVVTLAFTK